MEGGRKEEGRKEGGRRKMREEEDEGGGWRRCNSTLHSAFSLVSFIRNSYCTVSSTNLFCALHFLIFVFCVNYIYSFVFISVMISSVCFIFILIYLLCHFKLSSKLSTCVIPFRMLTTGVL